MNANEVAFWKQLPLVVSVTEEEAKEIWRKENGDKYPWDNPIMMSRMYVLAEELVDDGKARWLISPPTKRGKKHANREELYGRRRGVCITLDDATEKRIRERCSGQNRSDVLENAFWDTVKIRKILADEMDESAISLIREMME
jgi:hypothetical protein